MIKEINLDYEYNSISNSMEITRNDDSVVIVNNIDSEEVASKVFESFCYYVNEYINDFALGKDNESILNSIIEDASTEYEEEQEIIDYEEEA